MYPEPTDSRPPLLYRLCASIGWDAGADRAVELAAAQPSASVSKGQLAR